MMESTEITTLTALERLAEQALPASDALGKSSTVRRLVAGEALFLANERRPAVFVVNTGVIKLVYETSDGKSWIKGFAEAGVCFASLTALSDGGLTSFSTYAVTAAIVDQIDYALLRAMAEQYPAWQRMMSQAFKLYGERKEERERALLTLSPEERYLDFLEKSPALALRLRQHEIASYLRVTPVALSRIRARLKTQGRLA